MSRPRPRYGIRFQLAELREAFEAERAAEEQQQEAEAGVIRRDPGVVRELQRLERDENKRRWTDLEPARTELHASGPSTGTRDRRPVERVFPDFRKTVRACIETGRRMRLERKKALFFAGVAVAAPWEVQQDALAHAERFARHQANLRESCDRLLRSLEFQEALHRMFREELHTGTLMPTMTVPTRLQNRVDAARAEVVAAFERATAAVNAATDEARSAPAFVSRTSMRTYLWKNSASVLHRRRSLRAIFSVMPAVEGMNWLQEVHSCLAETEPGRRARVVVGFVWASWRTVATAWAMTRRRARAAVTVDR